MPRPVPPAVARAVRIRRRNPCLDKESLRLFECAQEAPLLPAAAPGELQENTLRKKMLNLCLSSKTNLQPWPQRAAGTEEGWRAGERPRKARPAVSVEVAGGQGVQMTPPIKGWLGVRGWMIRASRRWPHA